MNRYIPLSLTSVVITCHVIKHMRPIDDYCYEMLYQLLITLFRFMHKDMLRGNLYTHVVASGWWIPVRI